MQKVEIHKYSDTYKDQVLQVWEKSVAATHHFLKPEDFQSIKKIVQTLDFNLFNLYCLVIDSEVAGFLSVVGRKVEMLFLSPEYIGKGWGKKLILFAIHELKANKVDVNEQNEKAVRFYQNFGFETFERNDQDDQGNDYPVLRMRLRKDKKDKK